MQSAYRRSHSTETALLRLLNDVQCAADRGSRSLLILLDLSAAFDTIDIDTLFSRLESTFGITGTVLAWLKSYLKDRSFYVRVGSERSATVISEHGVPQGSVLGPLLFTLYIAPIANVISSFNVNHLQYADDTQMYVALSSDDSVANLELCANAVHSWFGQNGLALNPDKSEAILMGTDARLRISENVDSVNVAGSLIPVQDNVKSLGVTLDSTLSFKKHVDNVCKSCSHHIRALRHIRKSISEETAVSIACALVTARLDYCNALLYGVSQSNIDRLQRVQNSLARAVAGVGKYDHITHTLKRLHWLPISSRITYKYALITYKTITTGQPVYLSDLIKLNQPMRTLRSSSHRLLHVDDNPPNSIFASRAFYYAAPAIWNNLPYTLIDSSFSLPVFKRHLKTHLYNTAFRC